MTQAINTHSCLETTNSYFRTYINQNFFYNILETLGLDLFAWNQDTLEDPNSPVPKRRYTCLQVCQKRNNPFYYTPFDQGALVHNLDPDWKGACTILSYSWIRYKLQSENFLAPATYKITDSHLPHPMIVGDNRNGGPDVAEIKDYLRSSFGDPISINQSQVEDQVGQANVKGLLTYFNRFESHCTLIGTYALKFPPGIVAGPIVAHASAFVKRGDQCAWFDANHGEVAFERFEDFARWFTAEATSGSLSYIFRTNQLPEHRSRVSQVYDRPQFSESEQNENALSKRLTEKRNSAQDFKIALIPDYTLETYR